MKRKIDKGLGENMVVTSIYVNGAVLTELKKKLVMTGRSFNEEVDDWIKTRLSESGGTAPGAIGTIEETQVRYASLKEQHAKQLADTHKLSHWLKEQGFFSNGVKLFGQAIGYDLSNTSYEDSECQDRIVRFLEASSDSEFNDATGKFLAKTIKKGRSELGHAFITYLESVRVRLQVEKQLLAFRPVDQATLKAASSELSNNGTFVPDAPGREHWTFEEWKRKLWEEWNSLSVEETHRKKRPAYLGGQWTEQMKRENLRQMEKHNRLVRQGELGRVHSAQDVEDKDGIDDDSEEKASENSTAEESGEEGEEADSEEEEGLETLAVEPNLPTLDKIIEEEAQAKEEDAEEGGGEKGGE